MARHERRAPNRTERVTIQQKDPDAATDAFGQPVEAWEDVATRWCKVAPKSSTEGEVADRIVSRNTAEFEFRYDAVTAAISPLNRLVHKSTNYEITDVLNVEMRNDTILATGVASA